MNAGLKIRSHKLNDRTLTINLDDGKQLTFEDFWLRDHCRCQKCYHADTYQRANHILDIPDARVKSVENNDVELKITWDDNHVSKYTVDFLFENDYSLWMESRRFRPIMWSGDDVASRVNKIHVDKFVESVEGAKLVFQSLLDYGVALIEGVDVSMEGTERVCKSLGGVQHTMFGGMWSFTARSDHADTAYTNLPLATHTDSTYFTESTGLLVLHCIEHTGGSGGKTTLVDGFYGATRLKMESPEDFEFLSTHEMETEYIEKGHHFKYSAPIIRVDPRTNNLRQIRFNVYDRSAMPFANSTECRDYYKALKNLSRYYQDPENQWTFKLTPGLVMVIDNFRVLHGRSSFTGSRVMCGSYVARSDWLDRARVLKLVK